MFTKLYLKFVLNAVTLNTSFFLFVIKFTYSLLSHNLEGKTWNKTKGSCALWCHLISLQFKDHLGLSISETHSLKREEPYLDSLFFIFSGSLTVQNVFPGPAALPKGYGKRRIFALCFYRPTESESSVNKVPSLMISIHIKISEVLP